MLCMLIEAKFNKWQLQDVFLIPKANNRVARELNASFMLRKENW